MNNVDKNTVPVTFSGLTDSLRHLILDAKRNVSIAVNSELVNLYWNIGNTIRTEILKENRAEYGKEIIKKISKNLQNEFGKGYSVTNLTNFVVFAEKFPESGIIQTLSEQLSWSHFIALIYIKEELKRDFYLELCKMEHWSVRILKNRINSMLFERTAIAKKPDEQIKQDIDLLKNEGKMTADLIFRDPYVLEFLNLIDTYSEKDLESAILKELQKFIIEFGSDFAFLARQKRIMVDGEDYYIDLLFYHRKMRRLVVIELKLDKFHPKDKGQIEFYLRWLEKYEMLENENSPIGLILCAGKNEETVELMTLENDQIKVAEYLTVLPPQELLKEKLNFAIKQAKLRLSVNNIKKDKTILGQESK